MQAVSGWLESSVVEGLLRLERRLGALERAAEV
jgi:hypothetical protein